MGLSLAFFYQYIYLFFVSFVTFVNISKYRQNLNSAVKVNHVGELLLVIVMILFIGLRPISWQFVDMMNYVEDYNVRRGDTFYFSTETDNIIFDNLKDWWACNEIGLNSFFLLVSAIYFGCAYVGIKRLFGNNALIAYVVFLAAFSTFSFGTNGIKSGAAASIFIMALGYMDKKVICAALMLMSLGFHHSMIMPIAAFALTIFFKNPKWYYYGWFFCLLMAILHVSYFQVLFGGMADEQGASYLIQTSSGEVSAGFRPDFILYSAAPVIIGYLLEFKQKKRLSRTYSILIHFYMTTNAIWMLCMYAQFTNRIAYLSWFVYPIVLIYPFLDRYNTDQKRFMKLRKVVVYHLCFTLFMVVIYYGLFSLSHS